MRSLKNKIAGITVISLSGVLLLIHSAVLRYIIHLITVHISPDNFVKPGSLTAIRIYYFIFLFFIALLGVYFLFDVPGRIRDLIARLIDIEKVKKFFLDDEICPGRRIPFLVFVTGSVSGFLLLMYYLLIGRPAVEGILENITTSFLIISAILLIISAFRFKRKYPGSEMPGWIIISLLISSLMLLLLAGEEISWGQHLFGFESRDIFTEINFQGETNIHNLFNPFFPLIYPIAGFIFFMAYWMLWTFRKDKDSFFFNLFMPQRSLFILIFLIACSGCAPTTEIFEEMLYLMILLYSIRLFFCSGPKAVMK
ncbi:MAG: hypothetical protein RBU28_06500 [Bacteroidales bacterium]|jgi:hypothetical protein|nr:hypothetical protein [Bacteroidales bacterium]